MRHAPDAHRKRDTRSPCGYPLWRLSFWSVACKIGEHLRPVLVDLLCRGSGSIFCENSARGACWLFLRAHLWRLSENAVDRLANEGIRRETLRLSQSDKLGFLPRLKRQ